MDRLLSEADLELLEQGNVALRSRLDEARRGVASRASRRARSVAYGVLAGLTLGLLAFAVAVAVLTVLAGIGMPRNG